MNHNMKEKSTSQYTKYILRNLNEGEESRSQSK